MQCTDDLGRREFDRSLENFSIGLAYDLMVDIMISNVRVKRTIYVFATYTDKQHHGIRADLLARKWGGWIKEGKSDPPINNPG